MTTRLRINEGEYKVEVFHVSGIGYLGIIWTVDDERILMLGEQDAGASEIGAWHALLNKLSRWHAEQEMIENGLYRGYYETPDY